MMENPLIDDTAICPACDGSGFGVADTSCGFCGGGAGVPLSVAQDFENKRRIMTARPEFGDAIPVEGVRPAWLPDDVRLRWVDIDGEQSSGVYSADAVYAWKFTAAIKLPVPRYDFVYLALERGMVPWFGGPKPSDWTGRSLLFRCGTTIHSNPGHVWKVGWDHNYGDGDIIGYTRKATSTALPLAHPAAAQGEVLLHDKDGKTAIDRLRDYAGDVSLPLQIRRDLHAVTILAALAPAAIASGREGA